MTQRRVLTLHTNLYFPNLKPRNSIMHHDLNPIQAYNLSLPFLSRQVVEACLAVALPVLALCSILVFHVHLKVHIYLEIMKYRLLPIHFSVAAPRGSVLVTLIYM